MNNSEQIKKAMDELKDAVRIAADQYLDQIIEDANCI